MLSHLGTVIDLPMPYQVGFSVSPVRTSQVKGWTLGDALSNWAPFTLQPFKSEVVGGYSYPRELQVVLVVKELACHYRRHKRLGFDPQVGKIPWRRAWQPTPGFLPGEFCGQRSLAGCSPWDHRVGHDIATSLPFLSFPYH